MGKLLADPSFWGNVSPITLTYNHTLNDNVEFHIRAHPSVAPPA